MNKEKAKEAMKSPSKFQDFIDQELKSRAAQKIENRRQDVAQGMFHGDKEPEKADQ